jgi:hypothetical protein
VKPTLRKPDFFIVGAPKSGTTSLATYLREHPQIFMPVEKEQHFFGSDLIIRPGLLRNPRWDSLEGYLREFAGAGQAQRVGEASVWYLASQNAAREIHEFDRNASIIISLRNPVDMLYSLHSQLLYACEEDLEDFREALDAEEDRRQGKRIPAATVYVNSLFYRHNARYSEHVRRYFEYFGRERVLVVLFEDLKNDQLGTYRRILEFLGVDSNFKPDLRIENPNKRIRSRRLYEFLSKPPRFLEPLANLLARLSPAREMVRWIHHRLNTSYEPRAPLNPDLRRELTLEFSPEAERLSDLLQRDLRHWLAP